MHDLSLESWLWWCFFRWLSLVSIRESALENCTRVYQVCHSSNFVYGVVVVVFGHNLLSVIEQEPSQSNDLLLLFHLERLHMLVNGLARQPSVP